MIKYSPIIPLLSTKIIKGSNRKVPNTLMDWEVFPRKIHLALKGLNFYKKIKGIIVTENASEFYNTI
jgi:beta-glucosidase